MSVVATLVLREDGTDMSCPYVEGAMFALEITLPSGPVLQAQVRVINAFQPFTMSPVMRVALEEITSPPGATLAQFGLPMDAALKVYDHRFAHSARKDWKLKPFTPEHEAEYLAYAKSPHAPRTVAEMFGSEDRAANGVYRLDVDDPQLANAFASSAWEVQLLTSHWDEGVRTAALNIVNFVRS
ncbi:hypothetical protein RSAG8_12773, partial [Rhizoctonia solani AG-8 WAC10335]